MREHFIFATEYEYIYPLGDINISPNWVPYKVCVNLNLGFKKLVWSRCSRFSQLYRGLYILLSYKATLFKLFTKSVLSPDILGGCTGVVECEHFSILDPRRGQTGNKKCVGGRVAKDVLGTFGKKNKRWEGGLGKFPILPPPQDLKWNSPY